MTYDIASALTPKWKANGQDDFRYKDEIQTIIQLTGNTALHGLREFYEKTSKLEFEYSQYALQLCVSFWQASERFDDWKRNAIKKQLLIFLQEVGWKGAKASALIGAARLQHECPTDDIFWENFDCELHGEKAIKWIKSLKLFHQYDLSRMNRRGWWAAFFSLSEKGTKAVTREQLKELQHEYPRDEYERRGRPKGYKLEPHRDETNSTIEVIQTPEERFFDALESMDLESNFTDPEFRKRLNSNEKAVRLLSSWLPNPLRPTLSTIY